jgi:hypothetical protein
LSHSSVFHSLAQRGVVLTISLEGRSSLAESLLCTNNFRGGDLLLSLINLFSQLSDLLILVLQLLPPILQLVLLEMHVPFHFIFDHFLFLDKGIELIDLREEFRSRVIQLLRLFLQFCNILFKLIFSLQLVLQKGLELGLVVIVLLLFHVFLLVEELQLLYVHFHLLLLSFDDCLLILLQLVIG